MFGIGFQELISLALLALILHITGILPVVVRSMRGGGDSGSGAPPPPPRPGADPELDLAYQLLGISTGAPLAEIEQAYRRKAKKHHPDLGGDEDAMRALNAAYERIRRGRGRA